MNVSESLSLVIKKVKNDFSICPWQEIRQAGYLHWQIELILTPEQHYSFDPFHLEKSLYYMYTGDLEDLPVEAYIHRFHMAANPQPLYKYFKMKRISEAILPNIKLSRGWEFGKYNDYSLFASRKREDGRFEISGAKFCK